ncbi:MAG: 50S ribosomal protein L25 [Syntrophomonadaceae bacterium]|nr:50S ribosomal protein L25 [Syntrophomonadaceae bacterium]
MAVLHTLTCEKRDRKNKGYLKEMRRNQQIPGVVYGREIEPMLVKLNEKQLLKTFNTYGYRGLFSLEVEGQEDQVAVLVREVQKHPISGKVLHVDFLTVNMAEKIESSVAVYITGEEEVEKKGGILQLGIKEVDVKCFPQDLPGYLACDVSGLNIGDKITVGDLQAPEGVEIVSEPESVVALVLAPSRAVEEEALGEAAEAGEAEAKAEEE